jgi:hypothetical protein
MSDTIPTPLPPRPGYRIVQFGYHVGGGPIPVPAYCHVPAPPAGQAEAAEKRHFCRVRFRANNVADGEPVFVAWRDAGLPGHTFNGAESTTFRAGQIADLPRYEAEALELAGTADVILDFGKVK